MDPAKTSDLAKTSDPAGTSDLAKPVAPGVDPAAAGWARLDEDGFIGLVGPFWRRDEPGGGFRLGFLADERHANLVGIVQGGMLMTFADRALGTAAWAAAGDRPVVTIAFDMQFVNAAQIGSFVEVAPEVLRVTQSVVFLRGLLSARGTTLATCQGSWKILARRDRRPGPVRP